MRTSLDLNYDFDRVLSERQLKIQLPDLRSLAWSEWGPSGGRPVLFCTGAAMSGSLGFGEAHLSELGLRLIAIDRPGLGASDPHPSKTLDTWVDDIRAFLAANQIRDVTAVGFSQGAPFALALAGRELVQAAAIVSGQDQLAHPRIRPLLHPDVAAMITAFESDPIDFERYFRDIATEDGLWQLIFSVSSAHDRAFYSEPVFNAAFRRCLHEGFSQGPHGYARDLVNALGPWVVEPEQVRVPVDLWYGALDASTVHSPDFGATLAARLPNASLTVDPREGGSILWTRARDILASLASKS